MFARQSLFYVRRNLVKVKATVRPPAASSSRRDVGTPRNDRWPSSSAVADDGATLRVTRSTPVSGANREHSGGWRSGPGPTRVAISRATHPGGYGRNDRSRAASRAGGMRPASASASADRKKAPDDDDAGDEEEEVGKYLEISARSSGSS